MGKGDKILPFVFIVEHNNFIVHLRVNDSPVIREFQCMGAMLS